MRQGDLFYNTISLSGSDLLQAECKASDQNKRVLEIIKERGKSTPFEVSQIYDKLYNPAPVTSIRRSMTTLTKQGKLEMLDEMKKEKFGHNNHLWRVSND